MQTFIVATDFGPVANNAMNYAINLAKCTGARIVLFHLYRLSTHEAYALVTANGLEQQRQEKQRRARQYIRELMEDSGLDITFEVRFGEFTEEADALIKQYKASLLVLGLSKKTYEEDMLSTVVASAIHRLKFPILSVPGDARFYGIKQILYACDISRGIHGSVLETVKEYATRLQAGVEIFYVRKAWNETEASPSLVDSWAGINYTYKSIASDSVIKAIREEVHQLKADLLIMTPHRYSFWASIIHRSKTRAMASSGDVPLLSLSY